MAEIPIIEESGATGNQEVASKELTLDDSTAVLPPMPIASAIRGLASSKAKHMGGEFVAAVVSSSFDQLSNDLQSTKRELRDSQSRMDFYRDELSTSEKLVAVLEERVSNSNRQRHLRNTAISGGSIFLGLAVNLQPDTLGVLPFIIGGVGFLFVLAGWFLPLPEKNR